MKCLLIIAVALEMAGGCASRSFPSVQAGPSELPAGEDSLVLGAAIQGLGRWVVDWDRRTYVVAADNPAQPMFPRSKEQAAHDILLFDRIGRGEQLDDNEAPSMPWKTPASGEDLDPQDGPLIRAELIASILERSSALKVLPRPHTTDRLTMADGSRVSRFFAPRDNNGWKRFRRAFSGSFGLVSFSAPGYSASHENAVVYASLTRGYTRGVGVFVLLTKKSDSWTVVWSSSLWVS